MKCPFSRADVLVDADNVSSRRAPVAESVARDAQEFGYTLHHVHIVGRAIEVLADYERAFSICCPNADVSTARAWPGRNAADILAAIWLGRISYEVSSHAGQYQLYVLTRDKLVLTAARTAMGKEKTLVIPDDVLTKDGGSCRTLVLPGAIRTDSVLSESDVSIPQWASDPPDPANCVGLHWVESVETTQLQPPTFVPFPARLAKVRLGGGDGNLDIDLSPWDMPGRRRSLYSPHVVFEYSSAPDSCWTIRSTHGHRTGRRKVTLDGVLISAPSGPKTLRTGSAIEIGNFSFKFQDNPILNHVWFEEPKNMLERIERGFRYLVERLPLEVIPDKVRSELSYDGRFSWDHAYFRHYEQVFVGVLGKSLIVWVDGTFQSKNEIRRDLGSLNRIRNTIFHPSRGQLGESDREQLASLFLRYVRGAGDWPT